MFSGEISLIHIQKDLLGELGIYRYFCSIRAVGEDKCQMNAVTAASESEYTGYIVGTSGRILEFVTFDAQRMLIPMKSIKSMVVEKLSM